MKELNPLGILLLFSSMNLIICMDRGVFGAVLSAIKEEFNFDETKAGLLGSSFMLGFMIASPIFACLSRKYSSRTLIFSGQLI